MWHGKSLQFKGFNLLQRSCDAWETACSSGLFFFSGKEGRRNYGDKGKPFLDSPTRGSANGRQLTNVILAINVLVYIAQIATQGKLMLWGAKINSLIDKGQLWRLATSSLLHANIGHLMINSYSLNSIGPTVENLCGPRRYLVIYMTSAIASSAMSYWLSKSPAVGASGAIFGLVGSFAMFVLRHNSLVKGGVGDLQHVARVIALNMAIGLLSPGIDNWGHLGGLIGGVATSWLIGPAWKYEAQPNSRRRVLVDRAPIFILTGGNRAYR